MYIFTKYGFFTNIRRKQLQDDFGGGKLYYDRIIQGKYEKDNSLTKLWGEFNDSSTISTLSDVFISVKKLSNFPEGKEVIKSVSLGVEMTSFYMKEPSLNFKVAQPLLQGLTPASENGEYQAHYLISFAERTKPNPSIQSWYFRGGVNMNKLTNVWLDLEVDKSIPKDSYIIEMIAVCPTLM